MKAIFTIFTFLCFLSVGCQKEDPSSQSSGPRSGCLADCEGGAGDASTFLGVVTTWLKYVVDPITNKQAWVATISKNGDGYHSEGEVEIYSQIHNLGHFLIALGAYDKCSLFAAKESANLPIVVTHPDPNGLVTAIVRTPAGVYMMARYLHPTGTKTLPTFYPVTISDDSTNLEFYSSFFNTKISGQMETGSYYYETNSRNFTIKVNGVTSNILGCSTELDD